MDKTDFKAKEDQAREGTANLLQEIDKVTVGRPAGEVALACMERVLSIIEQPNCPAKFKFAVVHMMASAIVKVTSP